MRLHRLLLVVVALVALTVTACGSDDDGGSTSASTSGGGSATQASSGEPAVSASAAEAFTEITGLEPLSGPAAEDELTARVEEYTATPQELLVKEPVSKKAEPKTIAVVLTDVPILVEFYDAMTAAAQEIGWKVERIDQGATPQEFAQAYDRAIELKPDLVVGSGLPREYFSKQLDTLAEMEIPVIEWSSGIEPVEGKLWVAVDDPLYEASAIQLSEWMAADAGMKANVVAYNVPQYPMPAVLLDTMGQYLPAICPDCAYETQDAAVTDVGKLGQKVTGYVQQNPDTNFVVCGFGDLCQGVGQALRAAGRDDVKVVTRDASTTNLQNIANGMEAAATGLSIRQTGWQIIDLAQRIFNGDSTEGTRLAPQQIVTEVEDPSSTAIGAVADFEAKYRDLWLLGQ